MCWSQAKCEVCACSSLLDQSNSSHENIKFKGDRELSGSCRVREWEEECLDTALLCHAWSSLSPISHFSTSCMGAEPLLPALAWLYWHLISHRQCPSLTHRPCGRELPTLCTQMGIYKTYHKRWLSTLSLHWSACIRRSKEPC